jgi:non-canonical purine NTP pyrophosphatase (RdgB/HAM1 family)
VRRGELLKYGNGALHLSGNGNQFVYGVGLYGGLLSFSSSLSLGLVGDAVVSAGTLADGVIELLGTEDAVQEKPFTVNAKDNATAVVFKNETGWRMPVPVVSKGSIIKRGGGRMVWTVAGEKTFNSSGDGNGSNDGGFWPQKSTSISPLVFDDVNGGQPTAGVFMPLTVAEGELVIKGSGNGAKLRMPGSVAVAAPTAQGSVQPGLVLDNVELNYYTYACHFSLGPGLNYGTKVDFAKTPYLVLTNNATLNGLVMQVSRFGEGAITNRVIVDNSKMLITSSLYPNRSQNTSPTCLYEFRNNAKLLAALDGVDEADRTARFVTVITLIYPDKEGAPDAAVEQDGRYVLTARGECCGHITTETRGEGGFGYDPVFIPDGYKETFAQLGTEFKNTISHRAKALEELERLLEK